jgi:3-mercaptopyruvate sulfurtransferase SseA
VALLCAAAGALSVACGSPDSAGNSSATRSATSATTAPRAANANATRTVNTNQRPVQDTHQHAQDTSGVRRISVAELRRMMTKGETVVVDVRAPETYKQGHIKGAISIPHEEVAARASELPKDKLIVFYCA